MKIKTKVEFASQSKCVTAKTYIEIEDDNEQSELALEKAKELFNKAQTYAKQQTINM